MVILMVTLLLMMVNCWLVVSNISYFHPYLGKISILTNIFSTVLKPPTIDCDVDDTDVDIIFLYVDVDADDGDDNNKDCWKYDSHDHSGDADLDNDENGVGGGDFWFSQWPIAILVSTSNA